MRVSVRTVIFEVLLAVAFAAVAGGAAFVATQRLASGVEAVVTWSVASDPLLAGEDAQAYRAGLRSDEVLRDAAAVLGVSASDGQWIAELRRRTSVSLASGSPAGGTLRLIVSAPTEAEARRTAEALAGAVEAWDRGAAIERLDATATSLQARAAALAERIRAQQVLGPDAAGDGVDELVAERGEVLARLEEVRARRATGGGAALSRVDLALRPADGRPLRNAGLAAAGAVLLSALLGLRVPRRPEGRSAPEPVPGRADRTPSPRAQRRPSGTTAARSGVLAVVPRRGVANEDAFWGAIGRLRAAVVSATAGVHPRVVLVTGLAPRAGATTVACALAEDLARQGRRVLLVDGHLGAPAVAAHYDLAERTADGPGVTTMLGWLQRPNEDHHVASLRLGDGAELDVVPQFRAARAAPGMAGELFAGGPALLERWNEYEAIVVDAAAPPSAEETRLLAGWATGALLVLGPDASDGRAFAEARKVFRDAGTSLLGLVENDAPETPGVDGDDGRVGADEDDLYPRVVTPATRATGTPENR